MKLIYALFCAVLLAGFSVAVAAQDIEHKEKTKVEVKDGKSMKLTGCLARNDDGTLALTNVMADKDDRKHRDNDDHQGTDDNGVASEGYVLAFADNHLAEDVAKHIGDRIEIKGKAASGDDAKVEVRHESETKGTSGHERKTKSTSELKGDLPLFGVDSYKVITERFCQ